MHRRRLQFSQVSRAGTALLVAIGTIVVGAGIASAHKPLPAPTTVSIALSRTTAASGQAIVVSGSGCRPAVHPVVVELYQGADPADPRGYPVATAEGPVEPDGTFSLTLTLLATFSNGHDAPLPEGPAGVLAWCGKLGGGGYVQSTLHPVTIAGIEPSDDIALTRSPDRTDFVVAGGSCDQREVRLTFRYVNGSSGEPGEATVAPRPDGTWSFAWEHAANVGFVGILAHCGDPTGAGFAYRRIEVALHVSTVTSTSTPTTTSSSTTPAPPPGAVDAGAAVPVDGSPGFTG